MNQRSCIVPVLLLALCLAPAHAAAAADVPASAQAGAHAAAFARLILVDGKPRWKEGRGGYALLSYEDERLVDEIGPNGAVGIYVYNWERLVGTTMAPPCWHSTTGKAGWRD